MNTFRPTNPQNTKEVKDIVFLTLTLGWKKEKRPSGPSELDLAAGNLVIHPTMLLSHETFDQQYPQRFVIKVQKDGDCSWQVES